MPNRGKGERRAQPPVRALPGTERFAFCDLARQSFAMVRTGVRRFCGCIMLRKGVIRPGP